jgi:hypothetical protein
VRQWCWRYIAALVDHSANLAFGETAIVLFVAENQKQAGVVFGYVEDIFNPMLADLVIGRAGDTISLTGGITLEIRAADFRRLRGPTSMQARYKLHSSQPSGVG